MSIKVILMTSNLPMKLIHPGILSRTCSGIRCLSDWYTVNAVPLAVRKKTPIEHMITDNVTSPVWEVIEHAVFMLLYLNE